MPCSLILCGIWGILMSKIPCTTPILCRIFMAAYWTGPDTIPYILFEVF